MEQGRIDLDAPAESYLSRWQLPASPFDSDGVTIRRLLSHSAGLSNQDYSPLPVRPLPSLEESLAGESGGVNARSGRDDVRLSMEPGQQLSYSNGAFTILQLVIEEITGEDFSAFMQREVLDPLGMSSSTFQWRADMQASTAIGYDDAGQPMPNSMFTERAAGGLYSTATDMARFMAAGMPGPDGETPGRGVLTPETFSLMTAPFTLPDQMRASLGYEVEALPNGATGIGHGGSNTGTATQFLTLPDRGEGIVVLSTVVTTQSSAWSCRHGGNGREPVHRRSRSCWSRTSKPWQPRSDPVGATDRRCPGVGRVPPQGRIRRAPDVAVAPASLPWDLELDR